MGGWHCPSLQLHQAAGTVLNQAACPPLPTCAWCACVLGFCAYACFSLAAHRCLLQSPALSLHVCTRLLASSHLSIPVHISIHYNNPLSQSHLLAHDLSGSEFSTHCLLLVHPHSHSERARRAKLVRRTPWDAACPLSQLRAPGRSGEGYREPNGKVRRLRTCRILFAGVSGPQQTLEHNTTTRQDGTSGANPPGETRQLPFGSFHVPKPLYPAKCAQVRATAKPTTAQTHQHAHALCD